MRELFEFIGVLIIAAIGFAAWLLLVLLITSPFWAFGLIALHYVGWV